MHKIIFFLFLLVIGYGIYNASKQKTLSKKEHLSHCQTCQRTKTKRILLEAELARLDRPEYIVRYIIDVINHGSDTLGFRGGVMEGGYVREEDAFKIACYVLELSGKKSPYPYAHDAAMFYTSVCGGCHGNDGKGLGGNYPDLTRKRLLGIERREQFLQEELNKEETKVHL